MSCTDPYEHDFNRMHKLMKMINELYSMFYENDNYSVNSETSKIHIIIAFHSLSAMCCLSKYCTCVISGVFWVISPEVSNIY